MTRCPWRLLEVGAFAGAELWEISPVLAETAAISVGEGAAPPTVVIRRQRPYALLGPRDERLPRLADGIRVLGQAGLSVFVRPSGGSAVILDEGCLSFGVARPCTDFTSIKRNFEELTEGVRRALGYLGLDARFGEAPGSFCPGPYDLMVGRYKVAGIAQAMRGGYTLVSGMLLVSQDPVPVTRLLNAFYSAAGGPANLVPDNVAPLSTLLGRPVSMEEAETALRRGFGDLYELETSVPSPVEFERARRLLAARRLA